MNAACVNLLWTRKNISVLQKISLLCLSHLHTACCWNPLAYIDKDVVFLKSMILANPIFSFNHISIIINHFCKITMQPQTLMSDIRHSGQKHSNTDKIVFLYLSYTSHEGSGALFIFTYTY